MFLPPVVLTHEDHRFLVAEQLREIGVAPAAIVLEPEARNTAPAAAIAALLAAREDEQRLLLLLPSDHVIPDVRAFWEAVRLGIPAAEDGFFVTFGVPPTEPHTGYGYLETQPGEGQLRNVIRFTEKPDRATAETYVASGHHYWNAGIFLASAQTFAQAFRRYAPDIFQAANKALEAAVTDLDFLRLAPSHYGDCENISFDYAIMEKVDEVACVPLSGEWDDLGAWSALWSLGNKDERGNVVTGEAFLQGTTNSYVMNAKGPTLSVVGLSDVVAVSTPDAVLLAHKARAQEVREIVARLKAAGREEVVFHRRVHRPWGWFERLGEGDRYQVKCLMIKPGARLSEQSHHHRAEHWVVVRGTVEVTIDGKSFLLTENESTYIPIGARHRLANPGKLPARLIEVQSGAYLGEDDIVRYDDDFGRSPP